MPDLKQPRKRQAQTTTVDFLKQMHEERRQDNEQRHVERMESFNRFLDILERKL